MKRTGPRRPAGAAKAGAGPAPWADPLPRLEAAEVFAIKAFAAGEADGNQQLLAWAAIRKIAQADMMSFWQGGEDGRRATDFHEGKRFVPDQLRRIARLQPAATDARGEPPDMPERE